MSTQCPARWAREYGADLGRTLIKPVDAFIHWAEEHREVIEDNRVRFDAR
jgi:DNA-binding HxlR family transcriptional regulator